MYLVLINRIENYDFRLKSKTNLYFYTDTLSVICKLYLIIYFFYFKNNNMNASLINFQLHFEEIKISQYLRLYCSYMSCLH